MITSSIYHGYHTAMIDWKKWRLIYEGGTDFIDEYLEKFSARESDPDFAIRKKISFAPTHAKAAVNDIKNAIFQRIADVTRQGGTPTYQEAVLGKDKGVDLKGSTMNLFIGRKVLPELLTMKTVGIYIDREKIQDETKATLTSAPYIYTYPVEDILNFKFRADDQPWEYQTLLLKDHVSADDDFGLPTTSSVQYRLLNLIEDGVEVRIFNAAGDEIEKMILKINRIPFIAPELTESLLKDISNYQIALLNVESSDLGYILKSNFPFYIEQDDGRGESHLKPSDSTNVNKSNKEITVGATQGRRYGKGLDAPAFISPPSEPIQASMKKQQQIKDDIRSLVSLALSNVKPKMASAESKGMDERGLEAGLSYIGLELEYAEREIAKIWALYENSDKEATIKYPSRYSLKSDKDQLDEAAQLEERLFSVPSKTFRQEITKRIASLMLGSSISQIQKEKIDSEIDKASVLLVNPETIFSAVEHAVLPNKLAAEALGLPEGSEIIAAQDHADRAKRIAEAQASVNPASPDLNENSKDQNKVDKADK